MLRIKTEETTADESKADETTAADETADGETVADETKDGEFVNDETEAPQITMAAATQLTLMAMSSSWRTIPLN